MKERFSGATIVGTRRPSFKRIEHGPPECWRCKIQMLQVLNEPAYWCPSCERMFHVDSQYVIPTYEEDNL